MSVLAFLKEVAHCTQVHDMWPFGPLVSSKFRVGLVIFFQKQDRPSGKKKLVLRNYLHLIFFKIFLKIYARNQNIQSKTYTYHTFYVHNVSMYGFRTIVGHTGYFEPWGRKFKPQWEPTDPPVSQLVTITGTNKPN